WPGNVRELQSVLKQALLQMSGSVLLPEFLPSSVLTTAAAPPPAVPEPPPAPPVSAPAEAGFDWDRFVADRIAAGTKDLYEEGQTLMEREVIMRVLRHCSGNQVQAARILGITRSTLRSKISRLNITIERAIWAGDDQGE